MALLADLLNTVLFMISIALSVVYSIQKGWVVCSINCTLLALLTGSLILSNIEARTARTHVVKAARDLTDKNVI